MTGHRGTSLQDQASGEAVTLRRGELVGPSKRRKIDLIYNTTLVCPWDCAVCCVDAVHVQKRGSKVEIRSDGLANHLSIPIDRKQGSIYDQAALHRQSMGKELTLEKKLKVIDHLDGFDAKIDISGGDALAVTENYELLKYASKRLGKSNVTLTVTGAGSARFPASEIGLYIGEYNFTFDAESLSDVALRPQGYAAGNLKKAIAFVKHGVPTRAEVPLSRAILNEDHLTRLYETLNAAKISKVLIMRLFPVGRGTLLAHEIPAAEEYRAAIEHLLALEKKYGEPRVKVQCALKHLIGGLASSGGNPCDLVVESFGLMADGTLLASPWAIGENGNPLGEEWILGNLAKETLHDILKSSNAAMFLRRSDGNFGHCKIFSFLNSPKKDGYDRIFDAADPLYLSSQAGHEDAA